MKKIVTSVSLIALGLLCVQVAYAQQQAPEVESSKALPWLDASLAVRGFYDDNINGSADGDVYGENTRKDSFGIKVSPAIGFKYQDDETIASIRYEYGFTYYGKNRNPNNNDQSHAVDAVYRHQINDRLRIDFTDSFALAQEPETLSDFGGQLMMTRSNGDNIRNILNADITVGITDAFGIEAGYRNGYWDFDDESYAFNLNRMEHTPHINFYYNINESNRVFIGYQYNYAKYDGRGEHLTYSKIGTPVRYGSDIYDRMSHAAYVGYNMTLSEKLDWTIRAGAQYTEWEHVKDYEALDLKDHDTNPFVDAIATWNYMEDCKVQLGVRHEVGAAQWAALDMEATTVYANLNHQILPKLAFNFMGAYQHSSYGDALAVQWSGSHVRDDYFTLNPMLSYQIAESMGELPIASFVDLSYVYDNLHSNAEGRTYDRNRIFLGLRANY